MKRIIISISILLFSLSFIPAYYSITQSQSINIEKKDVPYQLPYPGLLPGHPLYFLKTIRDDILLFTTRDNLKKAKLYLHLSDKNMATARALMEDGKEQAATEQLIKGEERFLAIPSLLTNLKKQGGGCPFELVLELQLSNQKHKQIITDVAEKTTDSEIKTLHDLLQKNNEAEQLIQNLQ